MARDGPRDGEVGIVIGGGSKHEPAFAGYLGRGLADAAAIGDLDGVTAAARAADDATCSMGVALSACSMPQTAVPNVEVPDGQMEVGMGLHGEPGVAVADRRLDPILGGLGLPRGVRVAASMNGLGATSQLELLILWRRVFARLAEAGAEIGHRWVREYATSLDVAGASRTVMALDGAIGEGDHGVTMELGRNAAEAALRALPEESPPERICRTAADALLNAVGASSGPLWASALTRAATAGADRRNLDAAALSVWIGGPRDGVRGPGGAASGETTMMDARDPAAKAARSAAEGSAAPAVVLRAAAMAAADGAGTTPSCDDAPLEPLRTSLRPIASRAADRRARVPRIETVRFGERAPVGAGLEMVASYATRDAT